MKIGRYIIGLISGLTFGMLFAPKKGKSLREQLIKDGGESGQRALMTLFDAFKDAGLDAFGEMKKLSESKEIQSALNMSKDRMHNFLDDIEDVGYDFRSLAQDKIDEFSDIAVSVGSKIRKGVLKKGKKIENTVNKVDKKVRKARKTVKTRANKTKKKAKILIKKEIKIVKNLTKSKTKAKKITKKKKDK